ncbi:Protein MAK32 [Exophiala dermatitidis]
MGEKERLAFCTLGMFIIDEIEYINGRAAEKSIIGGAGTYAALGARLAAGAEQAKYVSWIVDMGSDFPAEFKELIDSWHTNCLLRLDMTRLTTRAWNGYGPNECRAFKYLTPKLRLDEHSLSDGQVLARSFHMVCSPARCISIVQGIMARRKRLIPDEPRPVVVWEPVPDLCTPEELDRLREAASHVDIVSPNADEFAAFFASMPEAATDRRVAVALLLGLNDAHPSPTALVIREGALGCTAYFGRASLHLHAYHQNPERVVDPTGGGNTFLGALAIAMTGTAHPGEGTPELCDIANSAFPRPRLVFALLHATVSASYAIEQTGMPTLSDNDYDRWNGDAYQHRFLAYLQRDKEHIVRQLTRCDPPDV